MSQKRKRPGGLGRYSILPRTALAIFLVTVIAGKSGLAAGPEARLNQYAGRLRPALAAFFDVLRGDEPEKAPETHLPAGQLVYESAAPALPEKPTAEADDVRSLTIDGASGEYQGGGDVYVRNDTDYAIDIPALLASPDKVRLSGDRVQVLIMHTHGTEAYAMTDDSRYMPSDADRTTDSRFNVLRVGQEICDILNARGIKTIHSETLNDSPAYAGSYSRALEDISKYIKDNPSIKLVLDVHRDAMVTSSGVKYKAVADIGGEQAAQMMLVCGTDAGGLVHDGWRDNLCFQLKLQQRINGAYPELMRPLNLRAARFNQHVTPGSMLLEVGTSGNTLEEALRSARLFADVLADMLLERR